MNNSDNNQSIKDGVNQSSIGKRKRRIFYNETPEKRIRANSSTSSESISPCELDIIAAKAQITKLKTEIKQHHTVRMNMRSILEKERRQFEEQHKEDQKSLTDMKSNIHKREQDFKEELLKVKSTFAEDKLKWDKEKNELQNQILIGEFKSALPERTSIDFGSALDSALQNELHAVSNCVRAKSKLAELDEEMATCKYHRDKATRKLNHLHTIHKDQESIIHRLEKRLVLVTRELDSFSDAEMMMSHERSLSGAGSRALLAARVKQLEQTLKGYRDLLAQRDQGNNTNNVVESLCADFAMWRNEAEAQRTDGLEMRVHLAENQVAGAQRNMHRELAAAQEEIAQLKQALREGAQVRSDEAVTLKQQLDNSLIELQRMKLELKSSVREYRKVCYLLLGYKIDKTGYKSYRISSMFAGSAEEHLAFTLGDNDRIYIWSKPSTGATSDRRRTSMSKAPYRCSSALSLNTSSAGPLHTWTTLNSRV